MQSANEKDMGDMLYSPKSGILEKTGETDTMHPLETYETEEVTSYRALKGQFAKESHS